MIAGEQNKIIAKNMTNQEQAGITRQQQQFLVQSDKQNGLGSDMLSDEKKIDKRLDFRDILMIYS